MKRKRAHQDQGRTRLPLQVVLFAAIGFTQIVFSVDAHGHGYMTSPKSRAIEHFEGDQKGWPIAGIKAALRREPCIGLSFNKTFTEVKPGPLKLEFLFPDGANHSGFCYAYLFDPMNPANRIQIGEMMDCARSDHPAPGKKGEDITGHMTVTIPKTLPCDPSHCVLQWVWTATHVSATNPQRYEHYDNCADIRIVEAQQKKATASSPPQTTIPTARQSSLDIGQGYLQRIIDYAKTNGGVGKEEAIVTMTRRIERLNLKSASNSGSRMRAQVENERGIELLRNGQVAQAVQAFEAAYRSDPTDAEIINNLGYAHLRENDAPAAEPLLLLALIYEPGRATAWANLGESYAKQGKRVEAVACLALAYRFSGNRAATRQFLDKLAAGDDKDISEAATHTLRLKLIEGDKRS